MGLAFALTKSFFGGGGTALKEPPKGGFSAYISGEPNWAGLAEEVLGVRGSVWGGRG